MKAHTCQPDRTCKCSQLADEPNENCPIHGWSDNRKCYICGRFMKRKIVQDESSWDGGTYFDNFIDGNGK